MPLSGVVISSAASRCMIATVWALTGIATSVRTMARSALSSSTAFAEASTPSVSTSRSRTVERSRAMYCCSATTSRVFSLPIGPTATLRVVGAAVHWYTTRPPASTARLMARAMRNSRRMTGGRWTSQACGARAPAAKDRWLGR